MDDVGRVPLPENGYGSRGAAKAGHVLKASRLDRLRPKRRDYYLEIGPIGRRADFPTLLAAHPLQWRILANVN